MIVCTSSVLTQQQRGRLNHARAILSKATLTREIMQRALGDIWPADLPVEMPEPFEVNVIPVARTRPLVLNVDDDAANRYVKTRSLLLGEMEVIEAETGTAALALIAERQPLLVLLDVNLPDVGGLEVCRRIKADWPDIIVIQISATATSAAEKVIGLESGADCYLTTPVEPMELIAVTRAMLRLRHAEAQAQEVQRALSHDRRERGRLRDLHLRTGRPDHQLELRRAGDPGISAGRHYRRALRPHLHGGRYHRGCPQRRDAGRLPGHQCAMPNVGTAAARAPVSGPVAGWWRCATGAARWRDS